MSSSIGSREIALLGAAACGAVVGAAAVWAAGRASGSGSASSATAGSQSTTSSAQSVGVYETDKAVAEYLMLQFGAASDILPYPLSVAPHNALDFATRTAALCTTWATKLGVPLSSALDVGCATGRTSFDLSRDFDMVVGVDFSHAFVAAANALRASGRAEYTCTREGETSERHVALVPAGVRSERCAFQQGDACALPSAKALGGPFSVIHGANLLCRLPDPMRFLASLPDLLLPGGLVVFVSPYSWLPQYTPRSKWLGGRVEPSGVSSSSAAGLTAAMRGLGFALVHEEDVPFLIREHVRKYQWGCSHATIWQLRA